MIRVALAQINPTVGGIEENFNKINDFIKKAKKHKVDLVIFPELALLGYPPEDLLLKNHFIVKNKYFLNLIVKKCKGIAALVGFVDSEKGAIYNSCAIIENGKLKDVYRKIILPNYGVFDEKRYFSAGDSLLVYTFAGYRFSLSICEDIWDQDFVARIKKCKLDFIVNISASPFCLGKAFEREKVLSSAAKKIKSYVFYCNLVGGQDELVFDGTSKVFSPRGDLIACAGRFTEDLLIFSLGQKTNHRVKKVVNKKEEEAFSALRLGLYDYVRKNGFKKVIVGVSGGIDSAVVVALAKIALGKSNVLAVIMPSPFTSVDTFSDAKKICDRLGVKSQIVDISNIFQPYLEDLKPYFKGKKNSKAEENIQARIRGNILMAFSNKFGYLVLNTGNKSEVSCGYCTLYGDMVGGFGLLKDVPKMLVYKIARYINKISAKEIIPESVLTREPSAELRFNQKDTDTLPPYELLDPILKLYVEEDYSLQEIAAAGFKKSLVKKIIKMVDLNEYKRRQSPVGIKITPRAFGKDRRMPITNQYSQ